MTGRRSTHLAGSHASTPLQVLAVRSAETTSMPMRLLLINNTPTPYNLSFSVAVAGRPGGIARTLFLAPHDSNRLWTVDPDHFAFDHRILPSLHAYVEFIELPLYLHWGLWSQMRRFQPDVISIRGYH